MTTNKIIKSVSFNITNETDAKILKAIKRRNFSGYVKKLLLADILIRETELILKEVATKEKLKDQAREKTPSERLAVLKSQVNKPKSTD